MLTSLNRATRRKLIKAIRSWGESYYVLSDGSSVEKHETIMHSLDLRSKDQLIDILHSIIGSVYSECESSCQYKLVELTTIIVGLGLKCPLPWEMPTALALESSGRRLSALYDVIPFSFNSL